MLHGITRILHEQHTNWDLFCLRFPVLRVFCIFRIIDLCILQKLKYIIIKVALGPGSLRVFHIVLHIM